MKHLFVEHISLKHAHVDRLTFSKKNIENLRCGYVSLFIFAQLELFCDFLQFDWLLERAAFHNILTRRPKELFYDNKSRSEV